MTPAESADLIDTATAYDAALADIAQEGDHPPFDVDAIAAHVDALTAALHATDLDRLHLIERLRQARGTITTLALAFGVLWPGEPLQDTAADALADLARSMDDSVPPLAAHALQRRADTHAHTVATAVLIADRMGRDEPQAAPHA